MAGPGMSKERYEAMPKAQRWVYWLLVIAVGCFIGYMWFLR